MTGCRAVYNRDVAAVALNLLALVLVLGISWVGMMWLAGRVHGREEGEDEEWVITPVGVGDPCPECDGVGAKRRLGGLSMCQLCEGTGEITSLPS